MSIGTAQRTRAEVPPRLAGGTPGRLRLLTVSVTAMVAVLIAATAGMVLHRQTIIGTSQNVTEPVLVDAQTTYTALSDADTTAAGGLLAGPVEPAALKSRYQRDIATAEAAVTDAAQRTQDDLVLGRSLRTVSVGVPFYTALVERAQTNNRLGYPVAAAYLGEASNYLRTGLLPAANRTYVAELAALRGEQATAAAWSPGLLSLVVLLALGALLVAAQVWVRRRFHRTFNLGLLAATALLLVVGAWAVGALVEQTRAVQAAGASGTAPLADLTRARLLALQARADDELTLVSRDSVPAYQADFTVQWPRLVSLLASRHLDQAVLDAAALYTSHLQVRESATAGQYQEAILRASGGTDTDLPAAAARLDTDLAAGVAAAQDQFDSATSRARESLYGLAFGVVLLCGLVWVCALLGLRARLREYR
jgi:hypothetical protein